MFTFTFNSSHSNLVYMKFLKSGELETCLILHLAVISTLYRVLLLITVCGATYTVKEVKRNSLSPPFIQKYFRCL